MRPDLVGHGLPVVSVGLALIAQVVHRLRALEVGAVGAGLVDHLPQQFGVLQHGAGTQMVLVEGLAVVVRHEQRALKNLQNAAVVDVGIGIVDEDAGLCITGRVDVEVVAAARNAAADELTVILEVHRVERDIASLAAQIADAVDHVLALLRGGHQFGGCLVADGHVVEIEAEVRALVAQEAHEVIAGDGLDVGAGVADGGTEQDAVLLEQVHSVHDGGVMAAAAAGIVGLRGALDGQHEGDVAQADDLFAEGIVDQGGVGVDGELHIVVLLGQLQDVGLADQRLAPGEHVEVHAQLLALRDDLVHIVKAQVVLVAVLAGPAAHAVHVAGGGGVEQDQPGDVALVLDAVLADGLGATEEGLVTQVQGRGAGHIGVQLVQHAVDEPGPLAVRVRESLAGMSIRFLTEGIAIEGLGDIHQLGHGLFAVLVDVGQHDIRRLAQCGALHLMSQRIKCGIHSNFLPCVV